MEQVWALIGLLAAMFAVLAGAFFHLGSKIDAQGRDLRAAIDAQGRELGARIDAQSERIDAQGVRIDALGARIDAHVERHAG